MSVLRLSRPGYPTRLIPLDDGAVGRISVSRVAIHRGSPPVVAGEHKSREAEKARERRAAR